MFGLKHVWLLALLYRQVCAAPGSTPVAQSPMAVEVEPEFVPLEAATTTTTQQPTSGSGKKIEDSRFWQEIGFNQLDKVINNAKKSRENAYQRKAKNIIVFIGDGMGITTITAGRIYKGQQQQNANGEEAMLAFDEFPFTGLAKTYNVDKQVPDSAGTATAMFCGIKTDYGAIGMDITRSRTNAEQGRLRSVMDWAQAEGKRTGVVTTTRITHATPAATYARIYHRDWECDTKVPLESVGIHKDIARQLVEDAPGNQFNVIMGGGLSPMGAFNEKETVTVKFEGSTEQVCKRGDDRNLAQEWLNVDNSSRVFVQTREQLLNVDVKNVDHVLGLFRNNHITYAIAQEKDEPSLKEMTEAAIDVLERGKSSKGYLLIVEGGRIDQAHHQNYARAAMHEVLEFDIAIQAALDRTNADETLILVTADHSHAVTLNGYPARGTDILGFANKPEDPIVYETLSYANGPGYWDHLANNSKKAVFLPLESFSGTQRTSPTYRHIATLPLKDETHGGEDVAVFANGPGASLVRGVFEQNYLAYIVSYAGCMGPAKNHDDSCSQKLKVTSSAATHSISMLLLVLTLSLLRA